MGILIFILILLYASRASQGKVLPASTMLTYSATGRAVVGPSGIATVNPWGSGQKLGGYSAPGSIGRLSAPLATMVQDSPELVSTATAALSSPTIPATQGMSAPLLPAVGSQVDEPETMPGAPPIPAIGQQPGDFYGWNAISQGNGLYRWVYTANPNIVGWSYFGNAAGVRTQ